MVDYSFYSEFYGGDLENDVKFNRLSYKASMIVDKYTFGRAKSVKDEEILLKLRFTQCELIDYINKSSSLGNRVSERLGDSSISYSNKDIYDNEAEIFNIVEGNLYTTGLMYRGVVSW